MERMRKLWIFFSVSSIPSLLINASQPTWWCSWQPQTTKPRKFASKGLQRSEKSIGRAAGKQYFEDRQWERRARRISLLNPNLQVLTYPESRVSFGTSFIYLIQKDFGLRSRRFLGPQYDFDFMFDFVLEEPRIWGDRELSEAHSGAFIFFGLVASSVRGGAWAGARWLMQDVPWVRFSWTTLVRAAVQPIPA